METTNCLLCGSNRLVVIYDFDQWKLVRCLECTLTLLNPRPTIDEMRNYYGEEYFARYLPEQLPASPDGIAKGIAYMRHVLDVIRPLRAPGRILEVGASTGYFLAAAREEGWETWGVEISEYAANYAREQLRLNVQVGILEKVTLPENYFDVVVMWHVIEHLDDPLRSLRRAHALLADDGLLVIRTPDISSVDARWYGKKWRGLSIPFHYVIFSPRTLKNALQKAGFSVTRFDFWISAVVMDPLLPLLTRLGVVRGAKAQEPTVGNRQSTDVAPPTGPLAEQGQRRIRAAVKRILARWLRGNSMTAFAEKAKVVR